MVDLVGLEGVGDFMEDVHHGGPAAGLFPRLGQRAADPQVGLHAGEQLLDAERLRNEVGRTEPERLHRRLLGRHGRHHEDGQVLELLVLLQALEQLQPVHFGHHDVEQQELRLFLLEERGVHVAAAHDQGDRPRRVHGAAPQRRGRGRAGRLDGEVAAAVEKMHRLAEAVIVHQDHAADTVAVGLEHGEGDGADGEGDEAVGDAGSGQCGSHSRYDLR